MRRRALAALALALVGGGAALAKSKRPAPYIDEVHGFQVTLPAGWQPVGQDTGAGEAEPIFKAANDATDQWLVVIRQKGPTDDVYDDPKTGMENFESGFAKAAPGYQRVSRASKKLPAKAGGKAVVPSIDLWFLMDRDGKPVTVGVRALFYRGYTLQLMVDSPGKKPSKATKGIVDSFKPYSTE